ncbi:gluconate 2-dehydrogenase subunit 3 family protein [Duganella aceris]|uniref:Gluconate 2-dehydrogenase subunit 3 family protein n=1 Tax=Duganella aceris TaxID=2703883 RepID=A0ABX0FUL9_9BURK|nr:gluconate 2-dehydrogenase subunit 3 family protein [Duganella aceris]
MNKPDPDHLGMPLRRRDFLRGAAGMALTSTLPATAAATASGVVAAPSVAHQPAYFTAPEWAFINAAVDRLIPADGNGPGGVEAGVPVFLDLQMELPYGHGAYWYMQGPFHPEMPPTLGYQLRQTPRELYRLGIALADRVCLDAHRKPFAQLDGATRDAVLHMLEKGATASDGTMAAAFFGLLLKNTREGYFADPRYGGNRKMAAWKMIGFPGARADFTDWIDQQGKPYPYGPVAIDGSKG